MIPMIEVVFILGLSAAVIAVLAVYWQNIIEWIKKAVKKIKDVLGVAVEGIRTFIMRTHDGFKSKARHYYRNKITREWEEVVYQENVDESEVPPEILAKVNAQGFDVEVSTTEELQLELKRV